MRGLPLLGQQQALQGSSTRRSCRACSGRLVSLRPCPAAAVARRAVSRRSSGRTAAVRVAASLDYIATASDEGVLKLPARTELDPEEIKSVYGYPRNLLDSYYLGRVIGAGSFGVVREGIEVSTGRRFAVKTVSKVPKRGAPTPRYLLKLRAEVEVMQQLGVSLNAVHLHDVFEDDVNVHMVMELCEGGALLERVESGRYSERYISFLVRSILRFIAQCHAKGIIYRDVKPDNFLFLTPEEDSPLKATDFGLSIRHYSHEPKLTSRSGTPAYMAPELVMQCYDEKADLWSVGMLGYQLLTGRFPFWEDVRNETLSDVWKVCSYDKSDEGDKSGGSVRGAGGESVVKQQQGSGSTSLPAVVIAVQLPPPPRLSLSAHALRAARWLLRCAASVALQNALRWLVLGVVRVALRVDRWFSRRGPRQHGPRMVKLVHTPSLVLRTQAILSNEIDWDAPELQPLSAAARDFLERLLQRNPVLRPSAAEALEHPWLAVEGAANDMPLKGSVVQRLQRFATYTHLKQVVLRMITEDMRNRGKAPSFSNALQELFAAYDKDKSGTISFEELADGLRGQGYVVNESEVRQLMEKMDMDHDGNVGGDEFLATLIDWGQVMQEQEWQSYVDQAFNRMDLDGDGFIDLDELLSELPAAYFSEPASEDERIAEAKRMLREADENGDGRISKQEFYNLLRDNVAPDSLSMYDDRLSNNMAAMAV
uniref:Non-specific serine/threonine protein kinase n=1 Tax=Tetradesmus obliquus TaxID=3088 RepID=A0A383WHF3_TETOB|eukprot:jgi/Sobl393_1/2498/SZX76880.1